MVPLRRLTLLVPMLTAAVPAVGQVTTFTATADLTIGGESEMRDQYSFVAITGLAFSPSGRIIVTDMRDQVVRVYESTGAFAYSIGRRGGGPGEFNDPVSATIDAEGLLWVHDLGNRRLNAYELGRDRAVLRTSRACRPSARHESGGADRFRWCWQDREHRRGSQQRRRNQARPIPYRSRRRNRAGRHRRDAAGRRSGRSHRDPEAQLGGRLGAGDVLLLQLFGPTFLVAYSTRGEWARSVTSRYDIEWFDRDGRHLRTIRHPVEGPPLSGAERKRAQERIDDFLTRTHVAASSVPGVPRRKTPIRAMAFDVDGNLWIERSVSDGLPREADVYDTGGRLMTVVRWNREIDLLGRQLVATAGSQALGVATDSLGVQRVVRLTWR